MVSEGDGSGEREAARRLFDQRRWEEALRALIRAGRSAPLQREDLDRVVVAAAMVGDDAEYLAALERLHETCAAAGSARPAARAAFWIGFRLMSLGTTAQAAGWLARAERHLDGEDAACAERGYLLLPMIFRHLGSGDAAAAAGVASEAAAIGERCGDRDLVALARNLHGRALLRRGELDPGLALVDEVMVAVTAGELSPLVTGIVYCNVIATCQEVFAVDRAREWTAALTRWCEEQSQLVNFTGNCQVHRAEIMQLGGAWADALEEVRALRHREAKDKDPDVFADACYQWAEIMRLRGQLAEAEEAYRLASRSGRDPQPGMALLRLAQGRLSEATGAIDRVVSSTVAVWKRARVLPAFIDIMLADGARDRAQVACEELEALAARFGTVILEALAARARGAIELEGDNPGAAIEPLRRAFAIWHRIGAPYLAARVRVLLGRAYLALGDADGAALELDAAREIFQQLGAAPDLRGLDSLAEARQRKRSAAHGLSPRELEVLRLVSRGMTNKDIAAELGVSERTVHRHLSNIFNKIDVTSRAAATAFAYENDLI